MPGHVVGDSFIVSPTESSILSSLKCKLKSQVFARLKISDAEGQRYV